MNTLSYTERAALTQHPLAKKLFHLMEIKKTNLALSADVTQCEQLLDLAKQLGPEICVLKTHVDILDDFSSSFIIQLRALAEQHEFLLFEDRKFADIGNTVKHQYEGGLYRIADWAHITNAHTLPGTGVIEGLQAAGISKQRGLLLLAEMSSAGNLLNHDYTQATVTMAEQYPHFVMGFIAQHQVSKNLGFITMTPGVQVNQSADTLGQRYLDPEQVILKNGSDIIIVGRGIYAEKAPCTAAKHYRELGWNAYKTRCAAKITS